MKFTMHIMFLVILFFITSCAYNEGVVMKENPAYIQFSGNASNVYVLIDQQKIDLNEYAKKIEETKFKVSAGNHKVSIYRNNNLISSQTILLENGKIAQVMIP